MKKMISALVAGSVLISGIPAMASDVNIKINDNEFIPKNALGEVVEPFIANGSTYLPVRAMGEAVGKTVKFDAENYAVYIGEEPSEDIKIRTPMALVGDNIYYDDEFEYTPEDLYYVIRTEKVLQLAKKLHMDEKIENRIAKELSDEESIIGITQKDMQMYEKEVRATVAEYILWEEAMKEIKQEDFLVTARHILVADKADADEIVKKLNNGEDFESVADEMKALGKVMEAATYSFGAGTMVEEFERATYNLEINSFTKEPVKTSYGYHVIERLPFDATLDSNYSEIANTYALRDAYVNFLMMNEDDPQITPVVPEIYGRVNDVEYTTEELYLLGGENYASTFEQLAAFEALAKAARLSDKADEELVVLATASFLEEFGDGLEIMSNEKKAYVINLIATCTALQYSCETEEEYTNVVMEGQKIFDGMNIEKYSPVKVYVDGKIIVPCDVNRNYVEPKNIDGTVYVPLRAICEALGMSAEWDNETRTVLITK